MLIEAEELARKDELTAGELKSFFYLIFDSILEGPEDREDENPKLPSQERPAISFEGDWRLDAAREFAFITILDGLNDDYESGEILRLSSRDDGTFLWDVGANNSFYSEFLGKRVYTGRPESGYGDEPLTDKNHAKAAKLVWEAFTQSASYAELRPQEATQH